VIKEVLALLSSGTIFPVLYEPVYEGLDSVARALVDLEERRTWGKGVIRVRKDEGERSKL
jgi:NADPH2:quinone reductase